MSGMKLRALRRFALAATLLASASVVTAPALADPMRIAFGDIATVETLHLMAAIERAREAGVDTALVHYYFGAKRELFDAVFIRRAQVWNNERVAAIDRYAEASGADMTLEGLLEAFLRPPFEWSLKGGPGWKHYAALVAQTNANPAFGGETMARYFDPAIHRLIELIARVLPGARQVDLYWAYHNLSGALTLTLGETGRLDRLSGGLCRSGDLESACDYMVRFAAAGFRAVCTPARATDGQ